MQGTASTSTGGTGTLTGRDVASRYGFTRASTSTSTTTKFMDKTSAQEKADELADDQDDLIGVDLNMFEEEGEDYEPEAGSSKDDLLKYTMTVNWMEKNGGDKT